VSHRNARTTFQGRLLIVARYRSGWPKAHIAAAMGISRKCVTTWLDRFAREGQTGLHDRSSRPHRMPARTSEQLEQRIVDLRHQQRRGPDWIGAELGVPARTVSRVLARHQVPRLAALDPITGKVIKASKHTAVRYERARPGELVHGRASQEATRDRQAKLGYDFVHSLVDDHSRLAYCEILPDEKGPTCAGFLTRAAAYFTAHGITRIERIMTDNAWAYRWSLRQVCTSLSARQIFIKPHCPWQNGKAERLNRTLATEWAYRQPFTSNDQRTAALAHWLEHYNTQRRHSALGGHPPISRLQPT
jgi:transposase InsO family protein